MSVLIPESQWNPGALIAMRQASARAVMDIAAAGSSGPGASQILYRSIRPTDLLNGSLTGRLTNPSTFTANTLTANPFSTFKLQQLQACVFFGYAALSGAPVIDEIQFGLGGAGVFTMIELDPLYASQDAIGYFSEPIFFFPNEQPVINFVTSTTITSGLEAFQLLGYIAEQPGTNVTPRPLPPSYTAELGRRGFGSSGTF